MPTAIPISCELALDIRHDVHDVAVALDEKLIRHFDRADVGDAADIVAAEIEQHQVLGTLFRVGEQLGFERFVFLGCGAAGSRARQRTDGDLAVAHAHQYFGAGAHQREAAEIEIEQERRRIGAAERPVEGERRQGERHREALRQHHLENVAGGDVLLGLLHHAHELGRRGIGDRIGQRQVGAGHGCGVR